MLFRSRQRLAAIGEVTARVVHQARHQAGLMGWSIHRLRRSLGELPPDLAATAARDLDTLEEAKQLIQATFDGERPDGAGTTGTGTGTTGTALAALAEDVRAQLAPKAEQAGVALVLRCRPGAAGTVVPATVREAVFNLVDNAIDAAAGHVEVVVDGAGDGDRATARIEVVDDGPAAGPGPDSAARWFEPFFSTKPDGSGMGLAIADALVAEVGGQVRHERRDGTTRFAVTLPGGAQSSSSSSASGSAAAPAAWRQ